MKKSASKTHKLSLAAMVFALSLLFLYASEVLPYMRFPFCFFACFCLQVLLSERFASYAWLCFLGTATLSFFLLPDRFSWFAYVSLLGHYGIVRGWICRMVRVGWIQGLCLTLYSNLCIATAGIVFMLLSSAPISQLLPDFPVILVIALFEILVFGLDLLYRICTVFYESTLRPLLF